MELPASSLIDGKYQLGRKLGEGGMGAVWEARHRGTGRRVALKVISASLAKSAEVVGRFQREAMASGAIESQYIAQIFDTGVDPTTGSPYTVMELLDGEDLQQVIRRVGPLPTDVALRVAAQACLGLRKAHEAGVVHRDIKPANLFLARREEGAVVVKLLDFGIAKVKDEKLEVAEGGALTRSGTMLGSPLYMSPEQALGKKDVDHRTDIWSLGVVLYEALAGRPPCAHVESMGQLILALCSKPPLHIQEVAPWVPAEVAAVVHRALSGDPQYRFQSAAEMADALRALLPDGIALSESMFVALTTDARSAVSRRLILTPGMTATLGMSTTVTSLGATRPRNRAGLVIPVVAVVAAAGGLAAWKLAPSRQRDAATLATSATTAMAQADSASVAPSSSSPPPTVTLTPVDRTVRLLVLPATASAEVDGFGAPVLDGGVAVTGSLGSVHHVRLKSGRADQTFEVAIADEGAVPPRIALPVSAPTAGTAPAATTTSTSAMHMDLK